MIGTCVLMLGSLITMQGNNLDYWPSVSCNKQGTVFDSVWVVNWGTASAKIYYQRNSYGTAPTDSGGVALPVYTVGGTVYGGTPLQPSTQPPAVVDTDDTSSTSPNFAAVWCALNNLPSTKPTVPFCSVNGNNPFPVGYNATTGLWSSATAAWVAVSRQLASYEGQSVMVVMVAFQSANNVYAQGFLVAPATGVVVGTPGNPVRVNLTQMNNYNVVLGGIAGDDYGNFVVAYTRQSGSSGTTGVFVTGFNYTSATFGFQEFAVSLFPGSQYAWSRVACYHGSSATSGGFVVGYNDMSAARYTTNWSRRPTLASSTNYYNNHGLCQSLPQTAQWGIACHARYPRQLHPDLGNSVFDGR